MQMVNPYTIAPLSYITQPWYLDAPTTSLQSRRISCKRPRTAAATCEKKSVIKCPKQNKYITITPYLCNISKLCKPLGGIKLKSFSRTNAVTSRATWVRSRSAYSTCLEAGKSSWMQYDCNYINWSLLAQLVPCSRLRCYQERINEKKDDEPLKSRSRLTMKWVSTLPRTCRRHSPMICLILFESGIG